MKAHIGKCALCQKEGKLTFEHIPPKSAFNAVPTRIITGEEIHQLISGENNREPWDALGLRYQNQQQGQGQYSLCEDCNNKTGSWYGSEYSAVVNATHLALSTMNDKFISSNCIGLNSFELYPLRFFKQIISMFLSINNGYFDDNIRKYVLDKESTAFDSAKYRMYMYLTQGGINKLCPYTIKYTSGIMTAVSEITTYPFGFILTVDQGDNYKLDCTDITEFGMCGYDEKNIYEIGVPVYETNTVMPLDFRTKEDFKYKERPH